MSLPTQFCVYLLGFLFGVLIAGFPIRLLIDLMWRLIEAEAIVDSPSEALAIHSLVRRYEWQGDIIGIVERTLYIAAILRGCRCFHRLGVVSTLDRGATTCLARPAHPSDHQLLCHSLCLAHPPLKEGRALEDNRQKDISRDHREAIRPLEVIPVCQQLA